MKIQITGYSGSGKSTFGEKLKDIYGLNLLHIDTIYFNPNWIPRKDEEVISSLNNFLENESWIIDGNYHRFLGEERLASADIIFFFNFSRARCLFNAIKRRIKYRNKTRSSAAFGCKEKLDFTFIMWILKNGRSKKHQDRYKETLSKYPDKIIIFKNRKQVNKYIESIIRN